MRFTASGTTRSNRATRSCKLYFIPGPKKATKVESKRDGERFLDLDISEFKVLAKVAPETFSEPK